MADIVITSPVTVVAGTNATKEQGIAGETLIAGQVLAKATSGLLFKCDNNSATPELRKPVGIALNGAAISQPVQFQTRGDITIGAATPAIAAGVAYYTSDAGAIGNASADNVSGDYTGILGIGKAAGVISLDIQFSPVVT